MSLKHGIHLLKYGRHQEALEYFLDCLYEDPLDLEAIMYTGIAYTETGCQNEAVRALEYFTSRITDSSEAWEGLGCAYYRVKRFDDAKVCFKKAMKITPKEPSVIRNLGLTCMVLQEEDEAYKLLEKAVALDSKDYRSVYALSSLCMRTKKLDEAETLLRGIKDDTFLPDDLRELVITDYQKLKSMIQLHDGFTKKA